MVSPPETYTVARGETLSGIVKATCGNSQWPKVAADNKLANPDIIKVGQELVISCASTKQVAATTTARSALQDFVSSARAAMRESAPHPEITDEVEEEVVYDVTSERPSTADQPVAAETTDSPAETSTAQEPTGQTASSQESPAGTVAEAETPTSPNPSEVSQSTTIQPETSSPQNSGKKVKDEKKITGYRLVVMKGQNFGFKPAEGAPGFPIGKNLKSNYVVNGRDTGDPFYSFAQAKGKGDYRYIILSVPAKEIPAGTFTVHIDGYGSIDGAKFLAAAKAFSGKFPGPPSKMHRALTTIGKIAGGGLIMSVTTGGGPIIGFGMSIGAWAIPTISNAYNNAREKRNAAKSAKNDDELQMIHGKEILIDAALNNLSKTPEGGTL